MPTFDPLSWSIGCPSNAFSNEPFLVLHAFHGQERMEYPAFWSTADNWCGGYFLVAAFNDRIAVSVFAVIGWRRLNGKAAA